MAPGHGYPAPGDGYGYPPAGGGYGYPAPGVPGVAGSAPAGSPPLSQAGPGAASAAATAGKPGGAATSGPKPAVAAALVLLAVALIGFGIWALLTA
ncbi:hypothetical protein HCN56_24945 [Streptomyces lonarensis]|uniref:Uncharacterized protein n=1 Tax=Streptomyces lonarensis TaxID=700599 RepID=A0A7X6D5W7_9ACTN|nr:hypothetical protein [Streptomyces lonarensis]